MALSKDLCIKTTEMHTAGHPFRIVESGYPDIKGATIMAKRKYALENLDHLRKFLMFEPRGHRDMFGALFVTPDIKEADLAVLFLHNEGYATMCGMGLIALGRYAVDRGLVKKVNYPETRVNIQCPCGLVRAFVEHKNERTGRVRFYSVPSFAFALDKEFDVKGYGRVTVDIGYGGAFYAVVAAQSLGLDVRTACGQDLVKAGTAVSDAVKASVKLYHPSTPDVAFLYGTILTDGKDQYSEDPTATICIFADRQLDRSPCGSGTTTRAAIQYAKKLLGMNQPRIFESGLTSGRFTAKVIEEVKVGDFNGVVVEVAGHAFYTGSSTFTFEEDDALKGGFLPR